MDTRRIRGTFDALPGSTILCHIPHGILHDGNPIVVVPFDIEIPRGVMCEFGFEPLNGQPLMTIEMPLPNGDLVVAKYQIARAVEIVKIDGNPVAVPVARLRPPRRTPRGHLRLVVSNA